MSLFCSSLVAPTEVGNNSNDISERQNEPDCRVQEPYEGNERRHNDLRNNQVVNVFALSQSPDEFNTGKINVAADFRLIRSPPMSAIA